MTNKRLKYQICSVQKISGLVYQLGICDLTADTTVTPVEVSRKGMTSLLKHFNIFGHKYFSNLMGKIFESNEEDRIGAVDVFILEIRNRGTYTPPTPEAIYEMAAQALSKFKKPIFDCVVDKETVSSAFHDIYDIHTHQMDPAKLEWFQNRISELSDKIVKLELIQTEHMMGEPLEGYQYMYLLERGNKKYQMLVFRPDLPFLFARYTIKGTKIKYR